MLHLNKISLKIVLIFFFLISAGTLLLADEISVTGADGSQIKLYNQSHALIIGISEYDNGWPKLPGVRKDVNAVKQALERQEFDVTIIMDPDDIELDRAYKDFINLYGMDPQNRLLFYFAGHGHTIKTSYGEDMGYIVPRNAANPNSDQSAFLSKAMAMQQIEVYAKNIQSKHVLFLFDACFSGSVFAITRAAPENISYKAAQPVRQFISSGSAEETVPDVSIFRQQFVSALDGEGDVNKDGYITGSEMGEFLQEKVVNYSSGAQHPQYGKIRNPNLDKGDFVFKVGGGPLVADSKTKSDTKQEPRGLQRNIEKMKQDVTYTITPEDLKFDFKKEYTGMSYIFGKVAFKSLNGEYLRAEAGGGSKVFADRDAIAKHESFSIIPIGGDSIAIKTYNGNYLSASEKDVNAKATSIGPAEIFRLIELEGNKIGIKTSYGKFLCAEDGGGEKVLANRDKIKSWEIFNLVKLRKANIQCLNGYYLRANNGGGSDIRFDRSEAGPHEVFEFVKIDSSKIALKTNKGFYMSLNNGVIDAKSVEIQPTEIFEVVELGEGIIALRAVNGKYLTAVGGGGFTLKADSDKIDDWQKFKLILNTK
jgi:hypothetical protein